jgi:hypothetical protein
MMLPTRLMRSAGMPSARRFSSASGEGVQRHIAVPAAKPRFEVDDRETQLGRNHCAGGGGIDVADHDQPVRAVGHRHFLIRNHHAAGLLGMASGADAEMMVGLGELEIGKDRVRHVGIVMLAGVDQHRLEIRRGLERMPERRHLHEIGSRGGDQVDPGWPITLHNCPAPRGEMRGRDRRRVDKER